MSFLRLIKTLKTNRTLKVIIVWLLILSGLEIAASFIEKSHINKLPPLPSSAEEFGDFESYTKYSLEFVRVRNLVAGNPVDYVPYKVVSPKKNYRFKFKNIDFTRGAQGFRSIDLQIPKPTNVYRIFVLGGSTVEGGGNDDWAFTNGLEEKLKIKYPHVEVVNAGVGGYFSQTELAYLTTEILDYEPDLVVIFDGRNDLFYSILPELDLHQGQDYLQESAILNAFVNKPNLIALQMYSIRQFLQKSSLLRETVNLLRNSLAPQAHFFPQDVAIKDPYIDVYLKNLMMIKAVLESQNIPGIIVFQPTLGYCKTNITPYEKSTIAYLTRIDKTNWLDQVAQAWPVVGRKIAALNKGGLVSAHDLSCLFNEMKETAYIDSVHYTPQANSRIAAALAEIINAKMIYSPR